MWNVRTPLGRKTDMKKQEIVLLCGASNTEGHRYFSVEFPSSLHGKTPEQLNAAGWTIVSISASGTNSKECFAIIEKQELETYRS